MISKAELLRQIQRLERRVKRMSEAICRDGHKYYYDHENECRICIGCGKMVYDDDDDIPQEW